MAGTGAAGTKMREWAERHAEAAAEMRRLIAVEVELVEALLAAEAAPEPWSERQVDTARWASMRLAAGPTAPGLRCIARELRAAFGEQEREAVPAIHHRDGLVEASNATGFGGIHAPEHGAADAQADGQSTQELGQRNNNPEQTGRRHGQHNR